MEPAEDEDQTDPFTVISTVRCETAQDLLNALYEMCEKDPRGEDVGQATAVAIDNKYVQVECVEYKDGTRTFYLSGI